MKASEQTHSRLLAVVTAISHCFTRVEPSWEMWDAVEALSAKNEHKAERETLSIA